MLGDEPVAVSAMGSVLVDPVIGEVGDIDSAMITLQTARGTLCHINNSRRAVYGYDQRVEVLGSNGMVSSDNPRPTAAVRYGAKATAVRDPLFGFFIDRYRDAYVAQLADFIDAVENKRPTSFTFEDGRRAQILADAALESLRTGRTVRIEG
jgi:myo-inositol 2-dehydrogenase/D-chiro-inositol 1-dehydrogenase